ncbi:permease [Actinomadura rayongensis]|uniref:Permease n=1 Tax=Actinomadura rayongensis TaxID=1429076 RepID=A0A6I4VZV9_9ACTN|nr:permease [Actinomadura rayongensis]MXQ62783.1 permease [Actinomadura rayongensis]
MSRAGLSRQLLHIGRAAGKGSRGDRVRYVALLTAAFVLALSALAGLGVAASYAGRDARDRARATDEVTAGQRATVLWRPKYDAVGDRQHQVIFIAPLSPTAAPPPGLPRWPAPGEAFLSPELARAGAAEHIATRYGRPAGTIAPAGLASPTERLAYVRPARVDVRSDEWFRTPGFGRADPARLGESADVRPMAQFLLALGGLVVLPAAALVVIAARCGSAGRDRRTALLQALGGGRRHRALVNCGEAIVPLTLGALLGTLPYLAAMIHDVRLPFVGYLVPSADLRAYAAWTPVVTVAAIAVALALVVGLHRVDRTGRSTRPRSFADSVPRWRLWLCAAMAAMFGASGYVRGMAGTWLYAVGTVGLWATVPSLAAVAGRGLGARLAAVGRRRGRVSPLVAGRWMVAHPGVMVRLATAVIIGAGLVSQTQTWVSRLNTPALEARASVARIGDTVVRVDAADLRPDRTAAFARALPPGFTVLGLHESEGGGSPVLSANCRTLRGLGLPCTARPAAVAPSGADDPRVRELSRWTGSSGDPMRVVGTDGAGARPAGRPSALVVFADPARRGESWRVRQAAYAAFDWPRTERLGELWLTGLMRNVAMGQWVLLLGTAGLVILMLAAAVSAVAEFLRFGPALAPVGVQSGKQRIFVFVALWNLTFPMAVATVVGVAVASWHGLYFIATSHDGHFSWTVMGVAAAVGGCLALLVGLTGGLSAIRAARRWRPAGD